ncbi:MAG: glycolate oxidase subunit GlcE [Neomegalonema sp.]|nr:glycolate oxidase subunit GlcE [Neomegalonema sp.]
MQPADEAELAALIAEAAASGTALEIIGGGSKRGIGKPVAASQRLSSAALTGITLYEPGALTLVAKAGTPLATIEAALLAENQRLPFEPMDYRPLLGSAGTEPTLGGMVAANVCGPRRIQAGACRDSLIGVRFVNGRGACIKSGGRVMKNVTGYDLVKLMAGSYGTLGVLSEASFKLLPRPESVETLILHGLDEAAAVAVLCEALGSPFDVTGAAHLPGETPRTLIRVEGFADSTAYRAGQLRDRLAHHAHAEIASDADSNAALWRSVRDVEPFAGQSGAVWRLSLKPTDGPKVVAQIRTKREAQALYDWGGGLVWLLTSDLEDAGAEQIRAAAAQVGGDASLIRASEPLRMRVPTFPPQAPMIAKLTAGLRAQFDPAGILNPGRMG